MRKRTLTLSLITILVLAVPVSISQALRDRTVRSVAPVTRQLLHLHAGLLNSARSFRQIGTLRSEKEELQRQVVTLQQRVATLEHYERENSLLRQELGVTNPTYAIPKVYTRTIVQGDDPLDRTFTVDVGSQQGVMLDQPAVYQGYLVGKVIEVRAQSAVVRSVTSRKSKVQVWITPEREKGLLVGDGNSATLTNITQGLSFTLGSLVETSGLGGSLPQGIGIGQLGDLQSKPSDLSQSFGVTLPFDPGTVESLFIFLTD